MKRWRATEPPRHRRRRARPARPRDWALVAEVADDQRIVFGPYTRQGAVAVGLREMQLGRRVQLKRFSAADGGG